MGGRIFQDEFKSPRKTRRIIHPTSELVWASGEAIRKEWLSYYHAVEKRLAKLKREWNDFENQAHEQYQRWYYPLFAKWLSESNQVGEEVHQLKITLYAIQMQIEVNGLTKKAALDRVMAALADKKDPFPTPEEKEQYRLKIKSILPELDRYEEEQMQDQAEMEFSEDENDIFEEFFEEEKGPSRPEDPSENEAENPTADSPRLREPVTLESYKVLYRKIVRLLHPDRGSEMNALEKTLWNETQIAYRARDQDALRTILLRIEGGGAIDIRTVESIGEIMTITQTLHYQCAEIEFQKRMVKKEFVYRFWASKNRPKNREKLKLEIQNQLARQLYFMKMELRDLQAEYDWLKRNTEKKRSRTSR